MSSGPIVMKMQRLKSPIGRLVALAGALVIVGVCVATPAVAAPGKVRHGVFASANWAGYAATAVDGAPAASFSNVFAAWVQPTVACTIGRPSYSAYWVGLGGYTKGSQALEQAGSAADCSPNGSVTYYLWYELVPAAPVTIKLPLRPGDSVVANVAVSKKSVVLRITNWTQKKVTFTKRATMTSPAPDVSSAEWIAEAPSSCRTAGNCTVLPLANFGNMSFVSAKATAGGHTGTISDPAWSANAIDLVGDAPAGSSTPAAFATPTPLSPNGSSFGVTFGQPAPPQPGAPQ